MNALDVFEQMNLSRGKKFCREGVLLGWEPYEKFLEKYHDSLDTMDIYFGYYSGYCSEQEWLMDHPRHLKDVVDTVG